MGTHWYARPLWKHDPFLLKHHPVHPSKYIFWKSTNESWQIMLCCMQIYGIIKTSIQLLIDLELNNSSFSHDAFCIGHLLWRKLTLLLRVGSSILTYSVGANMILNTFDWWTSIYQSGIKGHDMNVYRSAKEVATCIRSFMCWLIPIDAYCQCAIIVLIVCN